VPDFEFPGLKPGDRWCLCAARWQEAFAAGKAPRVVLQSTHERALEDCRLEDLKRHALDLIVLLGLAWQILSINSTAAA
jgi:uncharacterized protein (DUF2237 family)